MTKEDYLALCAHAIAVRKAGAAQAMQAAQEAAAGESKSSAGDKYETARAMAHADRDRAAQLWAEADDLETALRRMYVTSAEGTGARAGSIVITAKAVYVIGVGLGRVSVGPPPVFAISLKAPAAAALLGVKKGDTAKLPGGAVPVVNVL